MTVKIPALCILSGFDSESDIPYSAASLKFISVMEDF